MNTFTEIVCVYAVFASVFSMGANLGYMIEDGGGDNGEPIIRYRLAWLKSTVICALIGPVVFPILLLNLVHFGKRHERSPA